MAFGVRRNLHYPKLTDAVINRILDNPSALALRDLVSLMNFVTRVKIMSSEENRKKLYEAVLKRIGEVILGESISLLRAVRKFRLRSDSRRGA